MQVMAEEMCEKVRFYANTPILGLERCAKLEKNGDADAI